MAWRAHELLAELGRPLGESRILVVGVSYKPGVADTREAPAVEIIERLRVEGAKVDYFDPLVPSLKLGEARLRGVRPIPEDYDLAIVATLHPEQDYEWLDRCSAVLDCTYRADFGHQRFLP